MESRSLPVIPSSHGWNTVGQPQQFTSRKSIFPHHHSSTHLQTGIVTLSVHYSPSRILEGLCVGAFEGWLAYVTTLW